MTTAEDEVAQAPAQPAPEPIAEDSKTAATEPISQLSGTSIGATAKAPDATPAEATTEASAGLPDDVPGAPEAEAPPLTAERLPLLPWGEGSAPSLPSVDDGGSLDDHERGSIAGSTRSSTISVTPSVYEFVEENGRTYHRYKEGVSSSSTIPLGYFLPNDQQEQDRLNMQHACMLMTTGGKLFLAPIGNDVQNVLDIGTGTGIWAIEFAQQFPGAQVVGTDLSPIQPEYIPKNVLFEIDDAEDEWTWSTKFDYIHGRALVTCFKDPKSVIQQAFHALRPGGFLEYQDGAFPMKYIGDVPTESSLHRWNGLVMEAAAKLGRDFACAHNYRRWFEEAGFENVTERRFYWPMGQWVKGAYYKQLAAYCSEDLKGGLEAISQKMYRFVGLTQEEMKALAEQAREDLNNPKIHAYVPVVIVWGRKPGAPAAKTAPTAVPPAPQPVS